MRIYFWKIGIILIIVFNSLLCGDEFEWYSIVTGLKKYELSRVKPFKKFKLLVNETKIAFYLCLLVE